MSQLTHLNSDGEAHMVDVSAKRIRYEPLSLSHRFSLARILSRQSLMTTYPRATYGPRRVSLVFKGRKNAAS